MDPVDHPERRRVRLGAAAVKGALDAWTTVRVPVPGLHNLVLRVPPVVPAPATETAVFALSWASATGTGILVAAILAGTW